MDLIEMEFEMSSPEDKSKFDQNGEISHPGELRVCKSCKTYCMQIKAKAYGKGTFKYTDETGKLWYSARVCPKCRAKTRRKGRLFAPKKCIVCDKDFAPRIGKQKTCGHPNCKLKAQRNSVYVLRMNKRIAKGLL